jgi:hypothetical protein
LRNARIWGGSSGRLFKGRPVAAIVEQNPREAAMWFKIAIETSPAAGYSTGLRLFRHLPATRRQFLLPYSQKIDGQWERVIDISKIVLKIFRVGLGIYPDFSNRITLY